LASQKFEYSIKLLRKKEEERRRETYSTSGRSWQEYGSGRACIDFLDL